MASLGAADDDRVSVQLLGFGENLGCWIADSLDELGLNTVTTEESLGLAENACLLRHIRLGEGLQSRAHRLGSRYDVDDGELTAAPDELRGMLESASCGRRSVVREQKHLPFYSETAAPSALVKHQDCPVRRTSCVKGLHRPPDARYTASVRDIVFLAVVLAFFAIAVLFVYACGLMLGRESE
jgi:hypothetical protein